jgi:hypothetical protein
MPVSKSPLTPLYQRGELLVITPKSPPLVKGDRGGFHLSTIRSSNQSRYYSFTSIAKLYPQYSNWFLRVLSIEHGGKGNHLFESMLHVTSACCLLPAASSIM